jgi:hypothetical protein
MPAPFFVTCDAARGPVPTGIEPRWIRAILALAVTMLLSVLPFKAPSVGPLVLTTPLGETEHVAAAASMERAELSPAPAFLKVAKNPNRKSWGGDLHLAAGKAADPECRTPAQLRRPDLGDGRIARSLPRLRLRDPPPHA